MNKSSYLQRKRKASALRTPFKKEDTCYTCFRIRENCLCPLIQPFGTETRFVILMHPKEAKKQKHGTGRICRATLVNSEIIIDVDFTHHHRVNAMIQDPKNLCLVLYPGQNALNISEGDVAPLVEAKKSGRRLVVFLVDGTWSLAKKMITLSRNIRSLPRVSFTTTQVSIFQIKEQPAPFCLSTLESIHFFLGEADRRGVERLPGRPQDNLMVVFKTMIDFVLQCATDPSRPKYRGTQTGYSRPENRVRRKKWTMRNLVLPDGPVGLK